VPTGHQDLQLAATMWGGTIAFTTPMLFCVAFLFQFLVAGLYRYHAEPAPWTGSWESYFSSPTSTTSRRRDSSDNSALLLLFPEDGRMYASAGTPALLAGFVIGVPPDFDFMHSARLLGIPTDLHL